jgi:hypothetical protein
MAVASRTSALCILHVGLKRRLLGWRQNREDLVLDVGLRGAVAPSGLEDRVNLLLLIGTQIQVREQVRR